MATARFWETLHTHDYPWSFVVSHYWGRYPNPNSHHVFSEDLVEVGIDEQGRLRTKRVIVKTNKLPWWGKHLFSARRVALVEETVVDPRSSLMTVYTRNIGLRLFMGVTEKVEFRPGVGNKVLASPLPALKVPSSLSGSSTTDAYKCVWIESDLVGLRRAIKKFGIDRFKKNCVLATQGFDWVLSKRANDEGSAKNSQPQPSQPSSLLHLCQSKQDLLACS